MAELALLDPLALDREIRSTARDLGRARAAFDRGNVDDAPDPFARRRRVSAKASFDELRQLPGDPLFQSLARWIGALTIARVTFDDEEAIATVFARADHRVAFSEEALSARDIFETLIAEPSSSGRRPIVAHAFADGLVSTRDALAHFAERRREAVRLLGVDPSAIDPLAIAPAAEKVRNALAEMVSFPSRGRFEAALDATLARDAGEGWPAVLGPRWLAEMFRHVRLFDALRLDLPLLPRALGGTSFCRALSALGRAFVDADIPSGTPFVIARAPDDVLAPSRAALFGSLPMDAAFHRTVLGLGRDRARSQARQIAHGLAVSVLLDAVATLTSITLFDAPRSLDERFEDLTDRTFGDAWPRQLAGVLPRARPDRPTAFAGLLLAAAERIRLRDAFDEDWFRNARAHDELRHEHRASPPLPDAEKLAAAADLLVRSFREALG